MAQEKLSTTDRTQNKSMPMSARTKIGNFECQRSAPSINNQQRLAPEEALKLKSR